MRQTKILSGVRSQTASICPNLILASLIGLALAAPGTAQSIFVHRQGATVNDHVLGTNLRVSVNGAQPQTPYLLSLRDETGLQIASLQTRADSSGAISPAVLWERSGVVGCDSNASPNPNLYRFTHFEDAEALAGRSFSIVLTTIQSPPATVATRSLPLTASTDPFFYFSDAAACPRFNFLNILTDPAFITGIRLPLGTATSTTLYVVQGLLASTTPPPVDLRRLYPSGQALNFSGAMLTQTEPIGIGPEIAQDDLLCMQGAIQDPDPDPDPDPSSPLTLLAVHPASFTVCHQWTCPPCEAP